MRRQVPRVAATLRDLDIEAAVLTSIPSVAYASGYAPSWEMWPGYNPYVPDPVACVVTADEAATLVLPDYYGAYAGRSAIDVHLFPTYSHTHPPEPTSAFGDAVAEVLGSAPGNVGIEGHSLPLSSLGAVRSRVRAREWIDIADDLEQARRIKLPEEVEAIREACDIADLMQRTLKATAEPGRTELELATRAIEAAWLARGARFAILTQLASGPITATLPSGEPSSRVVEAGDVICLDVAPWPNGYWSDTCNGIVVGTPRPEHERVFDTLRTALEAGIERARPGARGREVDAACRDVVRAAGHDYPHHTGHGLGTAHTEGPRITPDSDEILEAGMVIALEPGIYIEGLGGFRHEHVLEVTDAAPRLLTEFEHTL
jgi:Xaa-Pro aminopeptidase